MTHLEAMRCVRNFSEVRVWSRHEGNAQAFAQRALMRFGVQVTISPTAVAAVTEADVICTTTSAREPVVQGAWLKPGAHVNAVGASVRTARELDSQAVRRSRLFVDRRESVMAEAGDFLIPREEGVVDNDHVQGELGEVVLGAVAGRRDERDITLFKSLGLAIEDVASARFIYERAAREGRGTWVELGGLR
jgi:ornithine cyclodeaminase